MDPRADARDLRRPRRRPRPPRQEGPARLPRLARRATRRAGVGQPVRARPARAGTSSARRSRCDYLGETLRRPGRRLRPRLPAPRDVRLRGAGARPASRSRRPTCTPGWSATTARRCRSRAATWSSSPRCARSDVDPMAIRLTLLRHHYRSDWEWTDAELWDSVDLLDALAARPGARRRCRRRHRSWTPCSPRWPTTSTPRPRSPRSTPGPTRRWARTGWPRPATPRRPPRSAPLLDSALGLAL